MVVVLQIKLLSQSFANSTPLTIHNLVISWNFQLDVEYKYSSNSVPITYPLSSGR